MKCYECGPRSLPYIGAANTYFGMVGSDVSLTSLVQCLWITLEAYPRTMFILYRDRLVRSGLTNLGIEGLRVRNTLDYLSDASVTEKQKFSDVANGRRGRARKTVASGRSRKWQNGNAKFLIRKISERKIARCSLAEREEGSETKCHCHKTFFAIIYKFLN